MRLMVLVVSLLLPSLLLPSLLLSVTAGAQVVVPPPPVNQEGMKDFCVFANQIYSLGAQLCVPGANAGMRCVSSEGSKSGGRAFWSFDAKEWPLAPGWRCGTGG